MVWKPLASEPLPVNQPHVVVKIGNYSRILLAGGFLSYANRLRQCLAPYVINVNIYFPLISASVLSFYFCNVVCACLSCCRDWRQSVKLMKLKYF